MFDMNVEPSPGEWDRRIETDEGLSEDERKDKLIDYREQICDEVEKIKEETSDIVIGLEDKIDKIDGD